MTEIERIKFVIYANGHGDQPITVLGELGQQNGERFYKVAETSTGIPGGQIKIPSVFSDQKPNWLKLEVVLDLFEQDEYGDAQIFAILYACRVKYDHVEKRWYFWNGNCWEADKRSQIPNLIATKVAAQYTNAAAEFLSFYGATSEKNKERLAQLHKRAKSLGTNYRIRSVLELAKGLPEVALSSDEWERDPWLLGVANGVIDLKTGELRSGRPSDYIRTISPVTWQGLDTSAPRFEKFLSEIFANDQKLINFVQRLKGCAITGLTIEHILAFLSGEGRNGKETLLEIIKEVLGDLAAPASKDVLMESRRDAGSATPHLYALRFLRLAWVSETKSGGKLNIEQAKHLSGGGTIIARPLHGNQITFTPHFTLFLITNHKPKVDADDYALWQRIILIPFTQSFVDEPKEKEEHKADKKLREKLRAELSGILAWLVRGCLEWQQQGLNPPDTVKIATKAYRQEEVLPADMTMFIEDCCTLGEGKQVAGGTLYKAYEQWAKSLDLKPLTNVVFGKRLKKRFEVKSGSPLVIYGGIGLLEDEK